MNACDPIKLLLTSCREEAVHIWLLEELGLPYEIRRYARNPKKMLAPPELRAVHPLGKSPVIVDDEGNCTVAETGAIIAYLVDKAGGRLRPPADETSMLRYRFYLHYAEGSLMPPLLVKLVLGKVPLLGGMAQKRIQPMIDVHLDFVESELTSRPWFAGDKLTAADIIMSFPLEAARDRARLDASRPATSAWLDTIHSRPAYKAALSRGGPYRLA